MDISFLVLTYCYNLTRILSIVGLRESLLQSVEDHASNNDIQAHTIDTELHNTAKQ